MRPSNQIFALVSAAILCASAHLPAQIVGTISGGPVRAHTNSIAPYTILRTTKNVQTLANGATITTVITSKMARDSSGRTYTENHRSRPANDGQTDDFFDSQIFDPTARTILNWNSSTKEAQLTHMPEPVSASHPAPATSSQPVNPRPRIEVQHEDLGTRTIAGVLANGHRTTRVIPVGQEGNDQPLTIVDEAWFSHEAGGQAMLSIHDDPRTGVQTTEVTDLDLGEPDPALFQLPEGYSVKDHPLIQQD